MKAYPIKIYFNLSVPMTMLPLLIVNISHRVKAFSLLKVEITHLYKSIYKNSKMIVYLNTL